MTTQNASSLPPLPPSLITTILSHLLPPSPPLPNALIAKPLLDRLTFLPPSLDDDIEPWLTPFPTPPSSTSVDTPDSLAEKLHRLASDHTLDSVTYAFDGEIFLARLPILPPTTPLTSTTTQEDDSLGRKVIVMFSYEANDRGWVYHAATHDDSSRQYDSLSWSSSPTDIPITPPESSDHVTPAEYWKDFGSPEQSTNAMENEAQMADAEDAYWASYGAGGASAGVSRNVSSAQLPTLKDLHPAQDNGQPSPIPEADKEGSERGQSRNGEETGEGGRGIYELPSLNGALDPLMALLSTIPDKIHEATRGDHAEDDRPSSPSRETSDLRDKIQGRIQSSIRDAWASYTGGAQADDLESKALGWLRIGRSVVDGTGSTSPGGMGMGDVADQVLLARLEVLKDMYSTVALGSEEEKGESFWRLVEGSIKLGTAEPVTGDEGHTQETYWE